MCRRQKCQESFFFFFNCFEVKFWMVSLSCGCLCFLYSLFIWGLSCRVKRLFLQLQNSPVLFFFPGSSLLFLSYGDTDSSAIIRKWLNKKRGDNLERAGSRALWHAACWNSLKMLECNYSLSLSFSHRLRWRRPLCRCWVIQAWWIARQVWWGRVLMDWWAAARPAYCRAPRMKISTAH